MVRIPLFAAALVSLLAVPSLAAADPHDWHRDGRGDGRRDDRGHHDHDHGRPGVVVRAPTVVVRPPVVVATGPSWRWHNAHEADARYQALRARQARLAAAERAEYLELEARQRRIDELRRLDAIREQDRLERIRRAHMAQAAQFHAAPSPQAQEEFARYSQRKATLLRIKVVADAEGRVGESNRASALLSLEEQRHAAWVSAHTY